MGMFLKPSKSGKSVNVYVGKGVNGKPFKGNRMRDASGAKAYTHLNLIKKGSNYVSRPKGGSVFRVGGQRGRPPR